MIKVEFFKINTKVFVLGTGGIKIMYIADVHINGKTGDITYSLSTNNGSLAIALKTTANNVFENIDDLHKKIDEQFKELMPKAEEDANKKEDGTISEMANPSSV